MIVIVPNGAERVPVVTNKPVKSDSIVVRQRRRTTVVTGMGFEPTPPKREEDEY